MLPPCIMPHHSGGPKHGRFDARRDALTIRPECTLFDENRTRFEGDTGWGSPPVCSPNLQLPNPATAPDARRAKISARGRARREGAGSAQMHPGVPGDPGR